MRTKNRKKLIISSAVILVGGIVGGTVAAAFTLGSSAPTEEVQIATVANDFYSTGEARTSSTDTTNPIRWTPPQENNFYQHLFYIAAPANSYPGVPGYILLADPSRSYANDDYGMGYTVDNYIGTVWQRLDGTPTGFDFITQPDQNGYAAYNNGLDSDTPDNFDDLTTAFYFANFIYSGVETGETLLNSAKYDEATQTYLKSGTTLVNKPNWTTVGTEGAQYNYDNSGGAATTVITEVIPGKDVQIWDDATYTSYEIKYASGLSIGAPTQANYFSDEMPVYMDNNAAVQNPSAPQDNLFLFPILTVQQDQAASVNGNLEMYLTFGGFQTAPTNVVSYRIVEYGTNTVVKDWTNIPGQHQSMDNYHLSVSGLQDGTYNVQFSSSFAYHCWAEYRFAVGDMPQTTWTEQDFYSQFPDAGREQNFGEFFMVDPNTGLVISYSDPFFVDSTPNNPDETGWTNTWQWMDPSAPMLSSYPSSLSNAPYFKVTTSINYYGQKGIRLESNSWNSGTQFSVASYHSDSTESIRFAPLTDDTVEKNVGLSENIYYVNDNNVVTFAKHSTQDDSGTWVQPEYNTSWFLQFLSNNEVPGQRPTYVKNTDKSKPSGTQNDGFILIPKVVNFSESVLTSNSWNLSLSVDMFQDTAYNLYYSVTPLETGIEGPKVHYATVTSKGTYKMSVNNLTPDTEYIINFYMSNAANPVLFPEVANKTYFLYHRYTVTPTNTNKFAQPDSISFAHESSQGYDANEDGDTTDNMMVVDNTDDSSKYLWSGDLNVSVFTIEILDMSNNVIVKEQPIDDYIFYTNRYTKTALPTEKFDVPTGQYRIVVKQQSGGTTKTLFDQYRVLSNDFTLGQITDLTDETEEALDVNNDGDTTDVLLKFKTDYNNENSASWNSRFYLDVYDMTNDKVVIEHQSIDDALFEGKNNESLFVVGDGGQLPKAELKLTIYEEKEYGPAAIIDSVTVNNSGLVEEELAKVSDVGLSTTTADIVIQPTNEYDKDTMDSKFHLEIIDPVTLQTLNFVTLSESFFDKNSNAEFGKQVKLNFPLKLGETYNIKIYQTLGTEFVPQVIYDQTKTISVIGN